MEGLYAHVFIQAFIEHLLSTLAVELDVETNNSSSVQIG
jgi:hypothetical protein